MGIPWSGPSGAGAPLQTSVGLFGCMTFQLVKGSESIPVLWEELSWEFSEPIVEFVPETPGCLLGIKTGQANARVTFDGFQTYVELSVESVQLSYSFVNSDLTIAVGTALIGPEFEEIRIPNDAKGLAPRNHFRWTFSPEIATVDGWKYVGLEAGQTAMTGQYEAPGQTPVTFSAPLNVDILHEEVTGIRLIVIDGSTRVVKNGCVALQAILEVGEQSIQIEIPNPELLTFETSGTVQMHDNNFTGTFCFKEPGEQFASATYLNFETRKEINVEP